MQYCGYDSRRCRTVVPASERDESRRRMNRTCSGWRCAVLAGIFMLASAAEAAEPPVRQVLVLQSFNRGNLVVDHFTGEFRVELDQRAGKPVNVVQVVVGPTGFVGALRQAVVDFIRSTYAGRPPPDLIVTIAGPAAVFARKYRAQLFPDTPLLFASVDQRFLQGAPLGENEAAVSVINDFPGLVDDILQVLPETRHVFMVLGSGETQQILAPAARNRIRAVSRSRDVYLVRRPVFPGNPASLCESSRPLRDLLFVFRHRRLGHGVCGRTRPRRTSRQSECAVVCEA